MNYNEEDEEIIPQCPNCKTELEGWYAPSKDDGKDILFVISIILLFLAQFIGVVGGAMQGSWDSQPKYACEAWFSKRWHYVVPTYQLSCRTVMWLRNKEDYKNK